MIQHLPHLSHLPHKFGGAKGPPTFAQLMAAIPWTSYWKMNSTTDSGTSGKTLTLAGAPSQAAVGAIRGNPTTCTLLDGSTQYASTASTNALNMTADYTISAWVRYSSLGAFPGITFGNTFFYQDAGNFKWDVPGVGELVYDDTITVVTGKWYNVVATRSGATDSIYVNGVLAKAKSLGAAAANTAQPFVVGAYSGGSFSMPGWIDEVGVLKGAALTAAQILALYTAGAKTMLTATAARADASHAAFTIAAEAITYPSSQAQGAAMEVAVGGGAYVSPNGVLQAVVGFGSTVITPPYTGAVTVGDAWRIATDIPTLDLGPEKYLRVPSSGVLT